MEHRRLGRSDLMVSPIGFGAFKIGRNVQAKYPEAYELPDDAHARALVLGVLELGINLFDTAPAYGLSEERLGRFLVGRRREVVLCTKAGETFDDGRSRFDFSSSGIRRSVQRSLLRLQTDYLDLLLIHSDGQDLDVLSQTDAVETATELREAGLAAAVGFSGKTLDGARAALGWADVVMIPYNPNDRSHEPILAEASAADVGVLVKKGLASGHLSAGEAIPFVLGSPHVGCMVIGGLDLAHMTENARLTQCLITGDRADRAS